MPIFQDDLEPPYGHEQSPSSLKALPLPIDTFPRPSRRLSEESIRTEFCEGPIPDSPEAPSPLPSTEHGDKQKPAALLCQDRAELIERLKRVASPPWASDNQTGSVFLNEATETRSKSSEHSPDFSPSAEIASDKKRPLSPDSERLRDGLKLERPRSALHTGDFRHEQQPPAKRATLALNSADRAEKRLVEGRSAESRLAQADAWIATSPPRHFAPFSFDRRTSLPGQTVPPVSPLSSSFSSSFAYRAPTTPLVQSESNEDLDRMVSRPTLASHSHNGPHEELHPFAYEPAESPQFAPPKLSSQRRRTGSMPYQAHQPRRSLTSSPGLLLHSDMAAAHSPLRSRRMSFGSESSSIQHASMVGSYEESILLGRMSTTPSKPLDFLAQIGVLGKGKCKASLRCPQHVTLPFHAVYYSYGSATTTGRSRSDDGPSPYVGQVDLENGLPDPEAVVNPQQAQSRSGNAAHEVVDVVENPGEKSPSLPHPRRRNPKAPRAPPGGSYRIPETGQIQIIIKNQNKTAVKLFLVPYDLTGMEPGTKTFIRQRSYSAGPVIDGLAPKPSHPGAKNNHPTLRYLVHLHVCCPSRGRYYLYKSIRVVFANRVPDGKESLRNETTGPEPRFSPYKPIRMMRPPLSSSSSSSSSIPAGPGAMLAADKQSRRRSLGLPLETSRVRRPSPFDALDSAYHYRQPSHNSAAGNTRPLDPIPFGLPSRHSDLSDMASTVCLSPTTSSRPDSSAGFNDSNDASSTASERYEKLSKGDMGYGGANSWRASRGAEGLLSMQLQELDVRTRADNGSGMDQDGDIW